MCTNDAIAFGRVAGKAFPLTVAMPSITYHITYHPPPLSCNPLPLRSSILGISIILAYSLNLIVNILS
jgi:hypothetical protein